MKLTTLRNRLLVAATVALAGLTAAAAGAREVNVDTARVDLIGNVVAAAIDPGTGDVATLDQEGDQIVIYPKMAGTGGDLVKIATGHTTVDVAAKTINGKSYFVVLESNPAAVVLVDVAGRTAGKPIPITGKPTHLATTADPACPFFFYCGGTNDGNPNGGSFGRFDLSASKDEGLVSINAQPMGSASNIVASPDGLHVYGWHENTNPSGIMVASIDPARTSPVKGKWLCYYHGSARYAVDPSGSDVAVGTTLLSPDFTQDLGDFTGDVPITAFIPGRAVALGMPASNQFNQFQQPGVDNSGITFYSTNTLKPIVRAILPDDAMPQNPQNAQFPQIRGKVIVRRQPMGVAAPGTTGLLIDAKNDSVLYWKSDKVFVVALKQLDLPAEPVLDIKLTGSRQLFVGKSADLKIEKADPGSTVSIESGPAGMTIDGDRIKWTPGGSQVGRVDVGLKVAHGEATRKVMISVDVDRPAVLLPFDPAQLVLSADGTLAIAFSSDNPYQPRAYNPNGQEPTPCQVAVIDLAKQTVVAQKTFPAAVQNAAGDGKYVYLILQSGNAVHVQSAADLSDVKRIFLDGPASSLTDVNGKTLYVGTTDGSPPLTIRVADLAVTSKAPKPGQFVNRGYPNQGNSVPVQMAGGWYWKGVLWDTDLTKPRLLVQPEGFLLGPNPMMGYPQNQQAGLPWGGAGAARSEMTKQMMMQNGMGRQMVTFAGRSVGYGLETKQNQGQQAREFAGGKLGPQIGGQAGMHSVGTLSVDTGASTRQIVLFDRPTDGRDQNGNPFGRPNLITAGEKYLAIAHDSRVYVVTPDQIAADPDKAAAKTDGDERPLQIVPEQTVFCVAADKSVSIPCKIDGGGGAKSTFEFALVTDNKGIEIDKSTGVVTVDGKAIADAMTARIVQSFSDRGYMPNQGQSDPVGDYQTATRDLYTQITGVAPTGLPVLVDIGISVRDFDNRSARLNRVVLLDVPAAPIVAAVKKIDDANQARFAPQTQPAGGMPTAGDVALRRRITELERRNAELEGQVELMKQLLGRGGPTSRPS